MTTETTIEKAKAVIEEMRELLAKLETERATPRRNWPEKVEAGMMFRHTEGACYIFPDRDIDDLICVIGDKTDLPGAYYSRDLFFSDPGHMTYLGHARDILTIRTDAHEPTGAELVGRRVNCFDTLDQLQFEGVCDEYDPDATYPYRIGKARYFKARLAK